MIQNSGISSSQNSINPSQKIHVTKNFDEYVVENVKLKSTKRSSYSDTSHDIRMTKMSPIKRNLSPRTQLIDDPLRALKYDL